jgi:hypothetical protein
LTIYISVCLPSIERYIQLIGVVFLPNDNNGGVRKVRIALFQQHGGTWVREWTPAVKYIMVEDRINYLDAMKLLNVKEFPVSIALTSGNLD